MLVELVDGPFEQRQQKVKGKDVNGVFMTPVHLVAADANGQPYMTQRQEPGPPGQPPKVGAQPAEVDVLVYGKVE